jgi:hypothetical protein
LQQQSVAVSLSRTSEDAPAESPHAPDARRETGREQTRSLHATNVPHAKSLPPDATTVAPQQKADTQASPRSAAAEEIRVDTDETTKSKNLQ